MFPRNSPAVNNNTWIGDTEILNEYKAPRKYFDNISPIFYKCCYLLSFHHKIECNTGIIGGLLLVVIPKIYEPVITKCSFTYLCY